MNDLVKNSLRQRPDRIIVGEVRDRSALDMVQAMCLGHDGSMSTGHARSAGDMLLRIESMALWDGTLSSETIRYQIAMGIDLIIQLKRDAHMKRYVDEIAEVTEYRDGKVGLNPIFQHGVKTGELTVKSYKTERGEA